jgi:hypothetical protein
MLNQLCRDQYTIAELRARPLPEGLNLKYFFIKINLFFIIGVDPSKIESYLSDADFQVNCLSSFKISIFPRYLFFRKNFI